MTAKKSKLPQLISGLCWVALRKIRKNKVVWYYYVSLLHAKLTKEWHKTNTYMERVMQVITETIRK